MKLRGVLTAILAIALGAVFVYASLDKIAHPDAFARIIYHYRLLGPSASVGPLPANLVAVTLPWVEILAGIALISGVWRREASGLVALLLVVFLGAVSWALLQGIDIENCGCFTVTGGGRGAGIKLLVEDVALLAVAFFVAASGTSAASALTTPAADE